MLTSITLTVPEELSQAEKDALRYLFADTLYRFQHYRSNPEEYVRKNYTDVLPPEALSKKVEQVKMRVALAEKLRTAALTNMAVNTTEPTEGSEI
jgi:hypothetical protein